ncbi:MULTISPECIES: outer membrane channel protein TolC [Providencia]|uniref:Outer membrane channel protein TolC n=2 Tax=Providencia stuartii TaxID=588 RepID=A0AAI9HY08_PROST|nr:outer membrane channel protein TolC [Providencia sp. PROV152]ELR5034699.1 outer membrane channel protein TolC [Providencia stuartii]
MNKIIKLFILISSIIIGFNCNAEDLLDIYKITKDNNPTLKKTESERYQAYKKIDEERSSLLPQLKLNANSSYKNNDETDNNKNIKNSALSLQMTQAIIDSSQWKSLSIQEKQAAISDINYQISQQDLLLETAISYFNILKSIDALTYIKAHKLAVYHQLDQTTQRFNVGLTTITDVQNARANYDSIIAQEVIGYNELKNSVEILRKISGVRYTQLAKLNINKLQLAKPDNITFLLENARMKNLSVLKSRLIQEISNDKISLAKSGHLPIVTLEASTAINNTRLDKNNIENQHRIHNHSGKNNAALSLNLPIYQGNTVNSQVKQAQYGFQAATEQLESDYRNVTQQVSSSYNNILSSISSIKAYKQLIISTQSSLDATEAGYQVGTRTIVDMLSATSALYQSKKNLSNAQYDYLTNQLKMEYLQGSLNENSIQRINKMLGNEISIDEPTMQ